MSIDMAGSGEGTVRARQPTDCLLIAFRRMEAVGLRPQYSHCASTKVEARYAQRSGTENADYHLGAVLIQEGWDNGRAQRWCGKNIPASPRALRRVMDTMMQKSDSNDCPTSI